MKSKFQFSIILILLLSCKSFSQTARQMTNPDYFYAEDLLLDSILYVLKCLEFEKRGITTYQFEIERDNKVDTFYMLNIMPSNKTLSVFLTNVSNTLYNKFNYDTLSQEDKEYIKALLNKIYNSSLEVYDTTKKEVGILYAKDSVQLHIFKCDSYKINKKLKRLCKRINNAKRPKKRNRLIYKRNGFKKCVEIADSNFLEIRKVEIEFEFDQIVNIKVIGSPVKKRKKTLNLLGNEISKSTTYKEAGTQLKDSVKLDNNKKEARSTTNENPIWVFQNKIPISYSTKADVSGEQGITRRKEIMLYKTQNLCGCKRRYPISIDMDDVFLNDYRLQINTENYSPDDQVLTLTPDEKGVIKKKRVTNSISARIFSDILGFDRSKPNGLVQTEFSHRFTLNSNVHPFGRSYNYFGFFNSAKPIITISKIEDNNKYLTLSYIEPPKDTMTDIEQKKDTVSFFATTIDMFKHASWISGGDINIAYLGIPLIHSMIYFNGGAYIRNIPMRIPDLADTLCYNKFQDSRINNEDNTFNVNTFTLSPEIIIKTSPHSQLRFTYAAKLFWIFNYSQDFKMVPSERMYRKDKSVTDNIYTIASLKFQVEYKLPNNGSIFFRSYLNVMNEKEYRSQNYFQAQIGCTKYIQLGKTLPNKSLSLADF